MTIIAEQKQNDRIWKIELNESEILIMVLNYLEQILQSKQDAVIMFALLIKFKAGDQDCKAYSQTWKDIENNMPFLAATIQELARLGCPTHLNIHNESRN